MKYFPEKTYYQNQVFRTNRFSSDNNPFNGQDRYHIARSKFEPYYPQDSVQRLTEPAWINPNSNYRHPCPCFLNRNQIASISDHFWFPKVCNHCKCSGNSRIRAKRTPEFSSDTKVDMVFI